MSSRIKPVIAGMSVLAITGIICKLVGVLYSIPLARILGDQGLGIFQTVFPTYNLLLTVSSAGLPVAVSNMVAHYLAKDDPRNAKHAFKTALILLTSIGTAFFILMLLTNGLLVRLVNVEEASKGFYVIAPCVAFVCVLSAFRGFIQGQQNMVPTAISQLIEQVGKVAVSLPLAMIGIRRSLADGAAGALAGITIVEAIAMFYMIIRYNRHKSEFNTIQQLSNENELASGTIAKRLLLTSIPITISACIIPLSQFVDSALMVKRMMASGLDQQTATALYGIYSGMVIRLINIPTALALAISMSLVPAISSVKALKDRHGIITQSSNGIRYAFLIGFPCAIGMSMLSKEILAFFYEGAMTVERLNTAAELLSVAALTCVLFTVVQATTSILQGLSKQSIPMYTMIAGVVCKIILNFILIGTPGINIHGGPIASIACYSIVMIFNLIFCCRHAQMRFQIKDWLFLPGISVLVMAIIVYGLQLLLPFGRLSTILEIFVGIAAYIGMALAVKAVRIQDIRAIIRKKGRHT